MNRLLLVVLMVLAPLAAGQAADIEMFTAGSAGRLTLDEQGRVVEVELYNQKLGKEILADYAKQIRAWRFEPVLIDGKATPVTGYMGLGLVAFQQKGTDGVRLGVRSVTFTDPPSMQDDSGQTRFDGDVARPVYPRKAANAGVGATVVLVVKVDQSGAVIDAAAKSVWLLGTSAGTAANQRAMAGQFARVSEYAAGKWRFANPPEGGMLMVPVAFTIPGADRPRWVRTHPVDIEVPAWVTAATEDPSVRGFAESGAPLSDKFRLLTKLDDNEPGAAGG